MRSCEERIYEILEGSVNLDFYTDRDILFAALRQCNGNAADAANTVKWVCAQYLASQTSDDAAHVAHTDKIRKVIARLS